MARRPVPIKVKSKDLTQIDQLLRGGVQQVRVVLRALAVRLLAEGVTAPQVAPKAIRQIAHRYKRNGLDRALYERPRPGARRFSTTPKSSALSPWFAIKRRKGGLAGQIQET